MIFVRKKPFSIIGADILRVIVAFGGTVSKMGLRSRGRVAMRVGTVLGAVALLAAAVNGQMGKFKETMCSMQS